MQTLFRLHVTLHSYLLQLEWSRTQRHAFCHLKSKWFWVPDRFRTITLVLLHTTGLLLKALFTWLHGEIARCVSIIHSDANTIMYTVTAMNSKCLKNNVTCAKRLKKMNICNINEVSFLLKGFVFYLRVFSPKTAT